MDVLLQRHCAKYIYVVPEGLRELMSDISREVLRSQPTELYTFIADYLDALMITRENARVAAKTLHSLEETSVITANLLIKDNLTKEEADTAATIIQQAFKEYFHKKYPQPEVDNTYMEQEFIWNLLQSLKISDDVADAAAKIIQSSYREYKYKKDHENQLLTGMIDWRVAARSTIALYRKAGVSEEEAHRAATLIKAAYKGYYTRRLMKRLLEEGAKMYYELEISEKEEYEGEGALFDDPYSVFASYGVNMDILSHIITPEQMKDPKKVIKSIVTLQRAYRNLLKRTGRSMLIPPEYEPADSTMQLDLTEANEISSDVNEGIEETTEAGQKMEEELSVKEAGGLETVVSILDYTIARVIPDVDQIDEELGGGTASQNVEVKERTLSSIPEEPIGIPAENEGEEGVTDDERSTAATTEGESIAETPRDDNIDVTETDQEAMSTDYGTTPGMTTDEDV